MIRSHRDFHSVKWSILSAVLVAVVSPLRAATSTEQPNIVIVMADDLGWNHVGVDKPTLGTAPAVYQTPNLARLASQGLSFPFAYAQPNCAPTRAAMLSG
ncbi:MAG: sulfatase-like hydrolase/transferase, partial [Pirellulales bacterium]|nr:sulfatase-like hydrolase/transferase [Pirellulales bacterium]